MEKLEIQNFWGTRNHTKVLTILGDGTSIQAGWHSSWELFGNHHESPYACGNYKVPKPSIHIRNQCNVSLRCLKTPFNAPAKALGFLLQLLDEHWPDESSRTAWGLPRHCARCQSGGTVRQLNVFRKHYQLLDTKTPKYASCHSCQPLSFLHWPFARIRNNQGCFAAEMQRHVLPLIRDTKTWLANTPNTCKPSPRDEREQRFYRYISFRFVAEKMNKIE